MKIKKLPCVMLALALLGPVAGYVTYGGYKSARQTRLDRQARVYVAKGETRKALLCLQRALRYSPKDVEACRLMADLAERSGAPEALKWRNDVVKLKPRSVEDRLALAQTALRFQDYATATNALSQLDSSATGTEAYHNVAGAVATALGQYGSAQEHFAEAARLDPGNAAPLLNLAVIQLHSTNAAQLAESRKALRILSQNPTNGAFRCEALRELTGDAINSRQTNAALDYSRTLAREDSATFTDGLMRLGLLQQSGDRDFKPELEHLRSEARTNSTKIRELGDWQMTALGPEQTLSWFAGLPMSIQTNQPCAMQCAECRAMMQDWKGLHDSLENQNWGELDFIRLAFLSRALRGQNLFATAKGRWEQALKATGNQKASLLMLQRLAADWKWQTEAEELLWAVVNRYPEEKWAAQALTQALYDGGRTRPLMVLFNQELKISPSDLSLQNNVAMTALLLDARELKPNDLARDVYGKAPTNAEFASTYAYSLHAQDKNAEALRVMEKLAPQDLEKPSVAGYYGLILKANGKNAKARSYLALAYKGPLLPEEKRLFDQAKSGLDD